MAKTVELQKVKVTQMEQGNSFVIAGDFYKTKKSGTNGDFHVVRITDNTGSAFARVWNNLPIAPTVVELEEGEYVEAVVKCTSFGDYINIEIQELKKIERPIIRVVDIDGLKTELREALKNIKDANLSKLIKNVFNRPDINEAFFLAPASMQSGYSFDGGLLAHTIRLIRLSKSVTEVFANWNHNTDNFVSKLNFDLLVTACILHDIGKVKAFTKRGQRIEKTMEGELFEDSYLSMKIILEELGKVEIPEYQRLVLEHVLGSSKGKQGYGALYIPRSKEALAFHLIDALDAQMATFEHLDRNATAEQEFVQLFQKTMFLGTFDEE